MAFNLSKGVSLGEPKPKIDEFNWGAKDIICVNFFANLF